MKQTAFRIEEGLLNDCKAIAKAKGTDLSKEVRRLLIEYRNSNKATDLSKHVQEHFKRVGL